MQQESYKEEWADSPLNPEILLWNEKLWANDSRNVKPMTLILPKSLWRNSQKISICVKSNLLMKQ